VVVAAVGPLAGCGSAAAAAANTGTATAAKLADIDHGRDRADPTPTNSNTADTNSVYNAYVDNSRKPQFATNPAGWHREGQQGLRQLQEDVRDPLTVK